MFLPGKFHGQRSLAGYSPWGHRKVDTTEHTHTHTDNCKFSLPRKTKSTQDSAMGQFPLDHSYRPRQVQKAYTHTHTHTHTHTDHSQISLSLLWLSYCTELRPREIDLGASVRLGTKGNNLVVINLILAPGNSTHY